MSGAVGLDVAQNALAEEREVADEVQHLVAHELVGEAQRRVVDTVAREHNAVIARCAADKAHVQHRALLLEEAEGTGSGNVFHVAAVGQLDLEALAADQGMREIDSVADGVALSGIDADELLALVQLVGAQDLEVDALAALLAEPGIGDHLDEGLRAAVEDGNFEVVELNNGVVDAHADKSRQQVLGGGDEDALLHQAGGVADLGHVAADGLDLVAIEIGAAEDDAGAGRSGQYTQANRGPAMKTDAVAFCGLANCAFVDQ